MYSQIIVIFIILGVFTVLHAVTLALVFSLFKKIKKRNSSGTLNSFSDNEKIGIVFCKECKAGYDAKLGVCPNCGSRQ